MMSKNSLRSQAESASTRFCEWRGELFSKELGVDSALNRLKRAECEEHFIYNVF